MNDPTQPKLSSSKFIYKGYVLYGKHRVESLFFVVSFKKCSSEVELTSVIRDDQFKFEKNDIIRIFKSGLI